MTCKCRVCEYGKQVEHQLSLLSEEQREFFYEMYMKLADAEMDSGYYKSIVEGKWPQSEEILALYRSSS